MRILILRPPTHSADDSMQQTGFRCIERLVLPRAGCGSRRDESRLRSSCRMVYAFAPPECIISRSELARPAATSSIGTETCYALSDTLQVIRPPRPARGHVDQSSGG